jgi:thymidylate synthase
MLKVEDIRRELIHKYQNEEFVTDKTGVKTVEIIGACFNANESYILRMPNEDYIKRELEWYLSQSLYVKDIPGETPKIWEAVADSNGKINSNYGYLIFSGGNNNQYDNVRRELKQNPDSRRANMIYTRPTIWAEYNKDGMSDFICTNNVQFFIRDGYLDCVVNMRSNDAVFGFNNDWAWHHYVLKRLSKDLKVELGKIIWQVGSLHVYERHFKFIQNIIDKNK